MEQLLTLTSEEIKGINEAISLDSPVEGKDLGEPLKGWYVSFGNGIEAILDVINAYDEEGGPFACVKWFTNGSVLLKPEEEVIWVSNGQIYNHVVDGTLYQMKIQEV